MCRSCALLTVAAITSLVVAGSPEITFTQIASPDTQVRPLGNRPAMHDGLVAFYGYRGELYGEDEVIALADPGSPGVFTILAQDGDPRTDVPGSVFGYFANPAIHDGRVVFLGGEFGTLPSTYTARVDEPYSLFNHSGINNPVYTALGVSSPASLSGIAYIDSTGTTTFLGLRETPLPCGTGTFGFENINGFQHVPQGGDYLIWPARVNTVEYDSNAIVAYNATLGQMNCVATGIDEIPEFGGPFGYFSYADTDGQDAVFIGYEPEVGFGRFQGVYLRDISGTGEIIRVVDTGMDAPGVNGNFGPMDHVTIDEQLIIIEGCAGGTGGCLEYGFFGCFLEDGVPGELFKILTTADTIGGRTISDLTMSPAGRDGHQFVIDVRHNAQDASIYVVNVQRSGICVADFTGDGTLDFFDVSAFLNAYNASDPIADLTGDGVLNFFDVSAFLNAFSGGCP
jgi:hypothetical protein